MSHNYPLIHEPNVFTHGKLTVMRKQFRKPVDAKGSTVLDEYYVNGVQVSVKEYCKAWDKVKLAKEKATLTRQAKIAAKFYTEHPNGYIGFFNYGFTLKAK